MNDKKFDPKKLQKLNDPKRLTDIPPDLIWKRLGIESPEAVVEIGAGTAFFCIAFYNHAGPFTVYACDISETMIQWTEENVCPAYPGIFPVKTEEQTIPLEDGIADLVYTINLHHELDNPAVTVAEGCRMLKPGGTLLVVDWRKTEMPEGPPVGIRCLAGDVKGQLEAAGLASVEIFDDLPKHFMVIGHKPRSLE